MTSSVGKWRRIRSWIRLFRTEIAVRACLALLVAVCAPGAVAFAADDGIVFPVARVEVVFQGRDDSSALADGLAGESVPFFFAADGALAAPRVNAAEHRVALGEFDGRAVRRVHASGVRQMLLTIREALARRTGRGVYVVPDPDQVVLRGAGEDFRRGGRDLRIIVYTSDRMANAGSPAADIERAEASPVIASEPVRVTPRREPVPSVRVARGVETLSSPAMRADPEGDAAPVPDAGEASEDTPAPGGPPAADGAVAPGDVPLNDGTIDETAEGEPIRMTGFSYRYFRSHPGLPPLEALDGVVVTLVRTSTGFVAREGEGSPVRLGDLGADGAIAMYPSAIVACERAIVGWFGEQSIVGVYVVTDPDYVDQEFWYDAREEADVRVTTIPLVLYAAQVAKVKTIASGDRVSTEDRLDSRLHTRIARHSPLQPWGGDGARRDLLRLEPLNTYAHRLSRHPGRRVDVAVADASTPGDPDTTGDAEVQYLVQEIKPWTAYFQLSNTGTDETGQWRERFGLVHNQLFGFDDIFTLDYITSEFRDSNAVIGSYNMPLVVDGSIRLRVNAGWSEYNATDVGVQNERFDGESFFVGPELSVQVFQRDDFFIDAYGGFQYQDIEVINRGLVDGRGAEEIFVASVGLRAEQQRATHSFSADVGLGFSINNITGAEQSELERLGRLDPDEEWLVLSWNSELSFYLDALLGGESGRLIHEVALRTSGQYSFNNRLIPNFESVGGGLYSVRGYPESVAAGDSGVFGSVEYRFHIPRAFPVNDEPPTVFGRPFRFQPDEPGGRPDWDLVFKAFVDAGRVMNAQALGFENNESLLSAGIGGELVIANNLSFRTDWGVVLDETGADTPDEVTVGSQRWHFVLTVLY